MENVLALAKHIKLVIFDVDGVLTDGKITFTDNNQELKFFNTQDGLGITLLQSTGVKVAIISGRKAMSVETRMQSLGIKYVYQGYKDKLPAYHELLSNLSLTPEEVAYVGDDLLDLPVMTQVGLKIAVHNAIPMVKEQADWTTEKDGGSGAAREVCELIMRAQGNLTSIYDRYLCPHTD